MSDFKRFFLRGLTAMLPTMITLMIIIYVFNFLNDYLGKYVNVGVQWCTVQIICLFRRGAMELRGPNAIWDEIKVVWETYNLSWLGFFLALVAIYIFGLFVASFFGRSIWRMIERALFRMPVIKQIYPYVKQVIDFLFSSDKHMQFSRVVAVEYPRRGVWALGLVTGPGMQAINQSVGEDLLTIFIPSSPTPITGYTITVKRDDVIDLPLSIDDALRFTVSGGVIMPLNQQMSLPAIEAARQGAAKKLEQKENSE